MGLQFLTQDGYQHAFSQLEFLRNVKRAEVVAYLREATEGRELTRNGAYEDARHQQALLEGRILELEYLLATAKVIDRGSRDIVSLGSVVHLEAEDEREYRYSIVGSYEASPAAGRISHESPVGKALLGRKAGEQVMVATPGGVKEYTILGIE
ncbi:MAG TPA: transcription elongation factor GreA [Ktedonobacteraceae bacterium]|nr:transcription elongation factor GreA [Ktedonobacteraceae bacterium]